MKGKILIVDDDVFIRESLSELLEYYGYLPITCENCQEGMAVIERELNTIDIVISDLKLPDMDGLTFIQETNQFIPNVPKIIITGFGTVEEAIKALKIGAFDFITKPITNYDEFFNILQNALEKKVAFFRHKENLETAKQIQQSLMPRKLPQSKDYRFGVIYKPLDDIGGDYWDYKVNPDGTITFFVADSFGQGIPAAFISIMAKMAFSEWIQTITNPADLLTHINAELSSKMTNDHYLTGFSVQFLPEKIVYANAGHPNPLLYQRSTDEFTYLEGSELFLGIIEDTKFHPQETKLVKGDLLLIFTDGLIEMLNENDEEFGIERVKQFLRNNRDLSIDEIIQKLYQKVDRFSEKGLIKDDLTILGVEKL